MIRNEKQMSDTFVNCCFLALSGGFQDAYTYIVRDKVFSNAQTGNVVLMSHYLFMGEWMQGFQYLFPLMAFAIGVFVAERIQSRFQFAKKIHWRQGILLIEMLILIIVGFMPLSWNLAATSLVSFVCAMQVQAFRKVNGYQYASTMCIGNLRSGTAALSEYLREKKREQLLQTLYYFGIIAVFAVGAGIGGNLSLRYGVRTVWCCVVLLLVSFMIMGKKEASGHRIRMRKGRKVRE
ncbi:MAG: YoaK family protein [Lachnospiraceae bacterium]|nr:YoaK family protein [Lachnospiraceae bacterium]